MEIKGLENMTYGELYSDIQKGGKFVVYTYVISIVVMTFRRSSKTIYYVKSNDSSFCFGWPYFLITLFFGWWGIPFGPIYSIGSLITTFRGKDVTKAVLESFQQQN